MTRGCGRGQRLGTAGTGVFVFVSCQVHLVPLPVHLPASVPGKAAADGLDGPLRPLGRLGLSSKLLARAVDSR